MTVTTPATPRRTAVRPDSRIQYLPGVGPNRALAFERLGIFTVEHLLRHYPRTYIDARHFVPIARLGSPDPESTGWVTVQGVVKQGATIRMRGGRTDFTCTVGDETGALTCYFFGQPFLKRTLSPGARVVVSGEFDRTFRRMTNPLFEVVEEEVASLMHAGRMVPVHGLTRGLTARGMRQAVRHGLDAAVGTLEDPLPPALRERLGLVAVDAALESVHFPGNDGDLARARRRLAFEELFQLQAVLMLRRKAMDQRGRGLSHRGAGELAARARTALPFTLTPEQEQALSEISADLSAERPMQRLLLGDVGSGKTVVAFLAALQVIECGRTVAFMAPTEILARQHAASLARFAAPAGVPVFALTGSSGVAERRAAEKRLASGEAALVVGTHALLEEKIEIPELGLAIVDEQHRFGVQQRARLAKKGALPDVLVLTATPIPRTLMLACYGDLDVSRITSRPAGRGRLVTRVADERKLQDVLSFMAKEIDAGRQAYVVVPLIEESEDGDARPEAKSLKAAEAEHRRLASHPILHGRRVELLHGRMKGADKQRIMQAFAAGEVDVLVATTVVEVGVDVPNATLMVVQNADRFGLSQLHQLRGRVGRGRERSVCVLIPAAEASDLALQRLAVLAGTEDGFKIAEEDLRLRGPGEMWGVRQHGIPRFRMADLARDEALLVQARDEAQAVTSADPQLLRPEHAALRRTLLTHYREPLDLALAG